MALLCVLTLCLSTTAPGFASEPGIIGQQSVVAVNGYSIAAVREDGSLWVWGPGAYGLASGSFGPDDPTQIMTGVESVYGWADGWEGRSDVPAPYTSILKRDGSLWLLGDTLDINGLEEGQSGSTPVKAADQVAAVSAGELGLFVLKQDGSLWEYGYDYFYNHPVREKVMDGVAAVSTCGGTTAAVKTDGSLWMWGSNGYGQLGIGGTDDQETPVRVLDNVACVSVGTAHTAAVKTDGSLWMWGDNSYGELGTGMAYNATISQTGYEGPAVPFLIQTKPVKVMDQVVSVSVNGVSGHSTHAIKADGSLWCWGDNSVGQLGNGGASTKTVYAGYVHASGGMVDGFYPVQDVPVKVMDGAAAVSSNNGVTAVVKRDGTLWVTGSSPGFSTGYTSSFEKVLDGVAVPKTAASAAVKFSDVPDWCADAAGWAVNQGVTRGVGDNQFAPDRMCTHVEILTMLHRAEGTPPAKTASPFKVASYYQDAVDWAYGEGIINDSFVPGAYCTRADAVTYIWQALGSQPGTSGGSFTDVSEAADYAAAVSWAVANGVTTGTGDGSTFSPDSICSRGQIVTFLYRAYVPRARLTGNA